MAARTTEQYFRTLGLARGCSEEELKKAYRSKALQFHPDRNPSGGDVFKQINVAYEALVLHFKQNGGRDVIRGGGGGGMASSGPGYRHARNNYSSSPTAETNFCRSHYDSEEAFPDRRPSPHPAPMDNGWSQFYKAAAAAAKNKKDAKPGETKEATPPTGADARWRQAHGGRVPASGYTTHATPAEPSQGGPPPRSTPAYGVDKKFEVPLFTSAPRTYAELKFMFEQLYTKTEYVRETLPSSTEAERQAFEGLKEAKLQAMWENLNKMRNNDEKKRVLRSEWEQMQQDLQEKAANAKLDDEIVELQKARQEERRKEMLKEKERIEKAHEEAFKARQERERRDQARRAAESEARANAAAEAAQRRTTEDGQKDQMLEDKRRLLRRMYAIQYTPDPGEIGTMSDVELYTLLQLLRETADRVEGLLHGRMVGGPCSRCKLSPKDKTAQPFDCAHSCVCRRCGEHGTQCPLCGALAPSTSSKRAPKTTPLQQPEHDLKEEKTRSPSHPPLFSHFFPSPPGPTGTINAGRRPAPTNATASSYSSMPTSTSEEALGKRTNTTTTTSTQQRQQQQQQQQQRDRAKPSEHRSSSDPNACERRNATEPSGNSTEEAPTSRKPPAPPPPSSSSNKDLTSAPSDGSGGPPSSSSPAGSSAASSSYVPMGNATNHRGNSSSNPSFNMMDVTHLQESHPPSSASTVANHRSPGTTPLKDGQRRTSPPHDDDDSATQIPLSSASKDRSTHGSYHNSRASAGSGPAGSPTTAPATATGSTSGVSPATTGAGTAGPPSSKRSQVHPASAGPAELKPSGHPQEPRPSNAMSNRYPATSTVRRTTSHHVGHKPNSAANATPPTPPSRERATSHPSPAPAAYPVASPSHHPPTTAAAPPSTNAPEMTSLSFLSDNTEETVDDLKGTAPYQEPHPASPAAPGRTSVVEEDQINYNNSHVTRSPPRSYTSRPNHLAVPHAGEPAQQHGSAAIGPHSPSWSPSTSAASPSASGCGSSSASQPKGVSPGPTQSKNNDPNTTAAQVTVLRPPGVAGAPASAPFKKQPAGAVGVPGVTRKPSSGLGGGIRTFPTKGPALSSREEGPAVKSEAASGVNAGLSKDKEEILLLLEKGRRQGDSTRTKQIMECHTVSPQEVGRRGLLSSSPDSVLTLDHAGACRTSKRTAYLFFSFLLSLSSLLVTIGNTKPKQTNKQTNKQKECEKFYESERLLFSQTSIQGQAPYPFPFSYSLTQAHTYKRRHRPNRDGYFKRIAWAKNSFPNTTSKQRYGACEIPAVHSCILHRLFFVLFFLVVVVVVCTNK
eukprot:gene12241-8427_t